MASVFLSYTHDSDAHRERVRLLAEKLSAALDGSGIKVVTDHSLLPGGPDKGFRRWSEQEAEHSDLVLPIFNASYRKRWDGDHPAGIRSGGTDEATVIADRVSRAGGTISFLRAVIFDDADRASIPARIRQWQCFHGEKDVAEIIAWIRHAVLPEATTPAAAGD